jgi:hypothetical protein
MLILFAKLVFCSFRLITTFNPAKYAKRDDYPFNRGGIAITKALRDFACK